MSSVQREWFEKDYYAVLGVPVDAEAKSITKAYRKLARELHPDANPGDDAAEERFKEVAAAYDVLGDESKRSEYDQIRSSTSGGGFPVGGFSGSQNGSAFGDNFESEDLGDLFSSLFGGGSAGQQPGPRRGEDMEANLDISFLDSLEGVLMDLTVTSDAVCGECGGSGCKAGTGRSVCIVCGGQGSSVRSQGFFSFSKPCTGCGGRGNVPQDPCLTCRGTGVTKVPQEVKVRVPAGVKNGQKIRLKGLGGPGRYGAPSGDLYVKIFVGPHPLFVREGNNILVRLPVSFPEAALGVSVDVPTPNGQKVKIVVPPGSASGVTLRVKGHGVKTKQGRGDLLAKLQIVPPKDLSDDQRELLAKMKDLFDENPRSHFE